MSKKRVAGMFAATAAALTLGLVNAPAASAETVHATTLTPVIGSAGGTGSVGYGGALVNESVRVLVDSDNPATSTFSGSMWCHCTVDWTNLTTGAKGTVQLPIHPVVGGGMSGNPTAETGSGRITAVVTTPTFTFLPGVGTWTVP